MDLHNQPKKRGRRKKSDQKDDAEDVEKQRETGNKMMYGNNPEQQHLAYKQRQHTSSAHKLFVEKALARFDSQVESDDLIARVHHKFMKEKYPNHQEREEGYNKIYKNVYKQIMASTKEQGKDKNVLRWWNVITRNAAEKVCEMINHILCSGPLMDSEVDILDRCVDLLKAYYSERAELISRDSDNRGYYYKYTYFPAPNTYAYRIFISKYDVSKKMEVQD